MSGSAVCVSVTGVAIHCRSVYMSGDAVCMSDGVIGLICMSGGAFCKNGDELSKRRRLLVGALGLHRLWEGGGRNRLV